MNNVLEMLLRKLQETRRVREESAAAGVPSWDQYNKLVGEIRGLILAERELTDLAEKVKDDE